MRALLRVDVGGNFLLHAVFVEEDREKKHSVAANITIFLSKIRKVYIDIYMYAGLKLDVFEKKNKKTVKKEKKW